MSGTINLIFTGPATQVPCERGAMYGDHNLRNDSFTFTRKESYLNADSPFDFGYELNRSIMKDAVREKAASFTVPAQNNMRRPSITVSQWESLLGNLEGAFWPAHLPVSSVPSSAWALRQDPDVDPLTIPGYTPMMGHPWEPVLGAEHRREYLGVERLRRLADGMESIKGGIQEERYLKTLEWGIKKTVEHSHIAKERDTYLFIRDGSIRAAEDNGLLLFLLY